MWIVLFIFIGEEEVVDLETKLCWQCLEAYGRCHNGFPQLMEKLMMHWLRDVPGFLLRMSNRTQMNLKVSHGFAKPASKIATLSGLLYHFHVRLQLAQPFEFSTRRCDSFARQDYNSWHRTPDSVAWEVFRQDLEMQRLIPHVSTIHFDPTSCLDVEGIETRITFHGPKATSKLNTITYALSWNTLGRMPGV